ncbi:MAG: FAD:protein FMN transferase [Pseudomonadales bacterium]|nr:FAD:protein FMN transferase [Pseudomonadales bacterium]RZV59555.1 MAG: FAD:protein FMN transferase [Pseudomonadales bacterium]
MPVCLFSRFASASLVAALFFAPAAALAEWYQHSFNVMGTRASVELWQQRVDTAKKLAREVELEMRRLEAAMSPYIESSELSLINREAFSRPVDISPEMHALLERSIEFGDLSAGAFDISFASAGHLYNYREGVKPSASALETVLPAVNYKSIKLELKKKGGTTVRFTKPGMKIDLGGIAKGYAVDQGIRLLEKHGVQAAMISAGGDSRMLGDRGVHPETGERLSWVIGVRHPRDETLSALRLPLSNAAISTSGDYERFFDEAGHRYHHIIVPDTGKSARGVVSVSIIGPKSIDCDALSTTVFVLGVEKGLALIDTVPEYDAIIIDANGSVHYSAGLAAAR